MLDQARLFFRFFVLPLVVIGPLAILTGDRNGNGVNAAIIVFMAWSIVIWLDRRLLPERGDREL